MPHMPIWGAVAIIAVLGAIFVWYRRRKAQDTDS